MFVMKKTFAIFLHHPTSSTDSVNGLMAAVAPMAQIKLFTKHSSMLCAAYLFVRCSKAVIADKFAAKGQSDCDIPPANAS